MPDGSWSAVQNITVLMDAYNWPRDPSIALGVDGVVHAFWYQTFYDDCLNQSGEAIFYKTLEEGTWVDRSMMLDGHVGNNTDVELDRFGKPNFLWSEMVGGAADVMLDGYLPTAAVDEPIAGASLRIEAAPNPFGSSTVLTYETAEAGPSEFCIVDTAGRLVLRLASEGTRPGVHRLQWDGRDAAGRPLPAGAYHARLVSGGKTGTLGLILVR